MAWQPAYASASALNALDGRWHEVQGQRVLLRLDLNVPVGPDHEILCDYRIRRVVGLIWRLSRLGCRVIITSHFGRPEGKPDPEMSLHRFCRPLARLLDPPITFLPDCIGPQVEAAINGSPPGAVFLLENLRFHPGEEAADLDFALEFTRFADLFVNDAFSVSHRYHASTVLLPQLLPAYAGPAFVHEYRRAVDLAQVIRPPLVVMSGGLKLDKLAVYKDLMPRVDRLLLGSGFAGAYSQAPHVLGDPTVTTARVVRPPDLQTLLPNGGLRLMRWEDLTPQTRAIDLGPEAIELYAEEIRMARTALFNGSPGALPPEHPLSSHLRLLSAFINSNGTTVVVGGTGCSLFIRENLARQVDYIFPGGGAILAFLNGQANPAIPVLFKEARAALAGAAVAYQPSIKEENA